jgi:hypothetical protein
MGAILLRILGFFSAGFVQQALAGAGLGLFTSTFVLTILNKYIASAESSFTGLASFASLLGIAGCDQALSIVVGAMVYRVTVNSLALSFRKAS